ncbi:unnamed protein product [Adineta steineri]|uniref:Uncharacterized protein n=1 Tax=Adineta steineri TaxID=433720 RepID=A0A813NCB4_9BILA|nr:unnamed protein product [Adineta steineri]
MAHKYNNDPPPPDLPQPNKLFRTCGRLPTIPPRPKPAVSGPDCSTWIFLYRSATSRSNPNNDSTIAELSTFLLGLQQQHNDLLLLVQQQQQQQINPILDLQQPPPPAPQL